MGPLKALDRFDASCGVAATTYVENSDLRSPDKRARVAGTSCRDAGGEEEHLMAEEGGQVTGTKDKDYNIIWFVEQCLDNALRLETYIGDAEREGDAELVDFFRRAQGESRKGAEQGKALLRARLG
jgi:hypothetical protein